MRLAMLAVVGSLLSGMVAFGEPGPARPAEPEYRVGEVDVQSLPAFTYAYFEVTTTLAKLSPAIDGVLPKLDALVESGKLKFTGPSMFTYRGADGSPDKEFQLQIGFPVDSKMASDAAWKKDTGLSVVEEPAGRCATLIYRGSMAHLKEGYGKLFGSLQKKNLVPTDRAREVYLYWEGRDSPNNLVQLQVVVEQVGAGDL